MSKFLGKVSDKNLAQEATLEEVNYKLDGLTVTIGSGTNVEVLIDTANQTGNLRVEEQDPNFSTAMTNLANVVDVGIDTVDQTGNLRVEEQNASYLSLMPKLDANTKHKRTQVADSVMLLSDTFDVDDYDASAYSTFEVNFTNVDKGVRLQANSNPQDKIISNYIYLDKAYNNLDLVYDFTMDIRDRTGANAYALIGFETDLATTGTYIMQAFIGIKDGIMITELNDLEGATMTQVDQNNFNRDQLDGEGYCARINDLTKNRYRIIMTKGRHCYYQVWDINTHGFYTFHYERLIKSMIVGGSYVRTYAINNNMTDSAGVLDIGSHCLYLKDMSHELDIGSLNVMKNKFNSYAFVANMKKGSLSNIIQDYSVTSGDFRVPVTGIIAVKRIFVTIELSSGNHQCDYYNGASALTNGIKIYYLIGGNATTRRYLTTTELPIKNLTDIMSYSEGVSILDGSAARQVAQFGIEVERYMHIVYIYNGGEFGIEVSDNFSVGISKHKWVVHGVRLV